MANFKTELATIQQKAMSNYQNTSQNYDTPRGSTPAPTRRSQATGSTPNGTPSANTRKERWAYIVLALFLGGFGVHDFYAGYHKRGAIELVVSLVGGALTGGIANIAVCVWVIYEAITVKEDAKGVPFA